MIKTILAKIAARLKEPSTFASFATVAAIIGFKLDSALLQDVAIGLGFILSAVAAALPEGK